jgi:hypothetical protein
MNLFQCIVASRLCRLSLLIGGMWGWLPASAIAIVIPSPTNQIRSGVSLSELGNALFPSTAGLQLQETSQAGYIPSNGLFDFSADDFLGIRQGVVLSTGQTKDLIGANCADGVSRSRFDSSCVGRLQDQFGRPVASEQEFNPNTIYDRDLNTDFCIAGRSCANDVQRNLKDDQVVLSFLFDADRAGTLDLAYIFGSEEYPEYVLPHNALEGTGDSFKLRLENLDTGYVLQETVTVASLFAPDSRVKIDNTLNRLNANKLALDGYTSPLQFRSNYGIGRNRLTLTLADVGDDFYDSAVFLQQLEINPDPPEPIPAPPLLFGFGWMGWLRWRDRRKSRQTSRRNNNA